MQEIWDEIIKDVTENQLCSICLPVDPAQITNRGLDALLSVLAKATTLPHNLELLLCMLEIDESLKAKVHGTCGQLLKDQYFPIELQAVELDQIHDTKEGKCNRTSVLSETRDFCLIYHICILFFLTKNSFFKLLAFQWTLKGNQFKIGNVMDSNFEQERLIDIASSLI